MSQLLKTLHNKCYFLHEVGVAVKSRALWSHNLDWANSGLLLYEMVNNNF